MTFNELITVDPEAAADKVIDALRYVINTCVPEMYVSREEWESVFPYVCQQIKDAEEPGAPESLSVKGPNIPIADPKVVENNKPDAVG